MARLLSIAPFLFLAGTSVFAQPKTIRVPEDHNTIQAAINAAVNGDTVLVAEGTYNVNLTLNKKIVLGSKFIINGEASYISNTILDGGTPRHVDSAAVIEVITGTDSTTVISGFTIRNGHGMRRTFVGTHDWIAGGGISISAGGAKITHNVISGNTMNTSAGGYGGGICIDPYNGPLAFWVIEYNQIMNNTIHSTVATAGAAEGGGIWVTDDGRIDHNIVAENIVSATSQRTFAGGINIIGSSNIVISNNTIRGNEAYIGGGMGMFAEPTTIGRPNITMINNLVTGNTSTDYGTAIDINSGDYVLINNTIVGNVGDTSISLGTGRGTLSFRMLNNTIWNPPSLQEINFPVKAVGSYNNIRGGLTGTGNINIDPLVTTTIGDSLGWFNYLSPCKDAGAESALVGGMWLHAPEKDYYGHNRYGNGTGTIVDIGAFEDGPWSGVEEVSSQIPEQFMLHQNFPNPFNPETRIEWSLKKEGWVRVAVYDVLGREVAALADEVLPAGTYRSTWNAAVMTSGVYICRMTAENFTMTRKLTLMK